LLLGVVGADGLHAVHDVVTTHVADVDVADGDLAGLEEVEQGLETAQGAGDDHDALLGELGPFFDRLELGLQLQLVGLELLL